MMLNAVVVPLSPTLEVTDETALELSPQASVSVVILVEHVEVS